MNIYQTNYKRVCWLKLVTVMPYEISRLSTKKHVDLPDLRGHTVHVFTTWKRIFTSHYTRIVSLPSDPANHVTTAETSWNQQKYAQHSCWTLCCAYFCWCCRGQAYFYLFFIFISIFSYVFSQSTCERMIYRSRGNRVWEYSPVAFAKHRSFSIRRDVIVKS